MGFFGIGTGEVLLILVLALIIWGPNRLPEIARTLGKTVRTLKKASFDLTNAVTREVEGENRPAPRPVDNPNSKIEVPPSAAASEKTSGEVDQPKNSEGQQP